MQEAFGQPEVVDTRPFKDWRLENESELRLETDSEQTIDIQLMGGTAEIFGAELAKRQVYTLQSRSKIAIFTWHGCTIRVVGNPDIVYTSNATPMVMYLNTNMAIDQLRGKAEQAGRIGAKVMVAGPTDVGKSTLCTYLLNCAVRMNRQPCFVDLDVGQSSISITGTMGILPVERPMDITEGEFSKQASLVYHFGHTSPSPNIKLYNTIVTAIADKFKERCNVNPKTKTSGCIINTCGWVDGGGYKILLHAARAFEVDVILVVDHERLYNMLQGDLPSSINIVPLPKSGGVVVRSKEYRKKTRDEGVREYFYGRKGLNSYFPFNFEVTFSEVKIFKIGAPAVPESALPLGMEKEDGSTQLVPVEPSKDLVYSILSLSMATSQEENLCTASIAGFLCVNSVDMEKQTMSVLSPAPRPLPRKFLLLSEVKFMDIK